MKKLFGVGLVAATALLAVPTAQAANVSDIEGKWSTWGCNTHWGVIGPDSYARYTTVQKLKDDKVFEFPAEVTAEGDKLTVDYSYRSQDYRYAYDIKNKDKMVLDTLHVNDILAFDRNQSNSPWKDRPTLRCAPAA